MATKKLEEVSKTQEELRMMCMDHLIDQVVRKELREELRKRFNFLKVEVSNQSMRLDKACELIGYAELNQAMEAHY
jgi:hypothetical protein